MSTAASADRLLNVPAAHVAAGWLIMAIDGLRLVLPQKEVREIGLVADLVPPPDPGDPEIGFLARKSGEPWPAYALDSGLELQQFLSPGRRFCVFFRHGADAVGLVCDRVWSLAQDDEIQVEFLPGCMGGLRTPVEGIARYDNGLATITSASGLAGYLEFLKEHGDDRIQ